MRSPSRLESMLADLALRFRTRGGGNWHKRRRPLGERLGIEHLETRLALSATPLITEFMASNDSTVADGDGNYSDWIEIHNPTSEPIDLAGWHLTDNPTNLDKWTFPSSPQSILDPGEYLLVFASSQLTETYVDPAGFLHTDFALSADGEYLALTNPNEEVVHEYAPTFPAQLADVSYGLIQNTTRTTLVGALSPASVLLPTSGALDAPNTSTPPAWTLPGFNASSWAVAAGGPAVGFDTGTDDIINIPNGTLLPGGPIGFDLTDPEEDGTPNGTITAGGSSPGNETPDRLLDNSTGTKWLSFEPTGTFYQFQFAGGVRNAVNGYTITSANDASERDPYSWVLQGSNDGTNWVAVDTRTAQIFSARHETRLYEFANNTAYEYYRFDFQTRWGATGVRPTPNSLQIAELELLSSGPVDYNPLLDIDLAAAWQTNPSSVYQRIEFDVADPSVYVSLELEMQYDDGFVAYLNGTRVASSLAPSLPNWQSHSTGERDDAESLAPATFNLTAMLDLLVAGTNVLSIHVLNSSDIDPDMLSIPRLTGVELVDDAVVIGFMPVPTPGGANSSTGVSRGPTITEVTENPPRPTSTEDLVITARVAEAGAPVDMVTLYYRVMFGAEVPLTMLDDGLGSDLVAGDGVYTAVIPSSAYGTGQMVRWYVTATDTVADEARYPLFLSPTNSPEYLGTVTVQPNVSQTLPVFEYFVENVAASGTETGTRASVYFRGEFYDNVFIRRRGGNTTQGRKFEFNDGHHFLFDPAHGRVDEINLNERGADPTYMRQVLSWELFAAAGLPASIGQAWYTRINDSYLDVRIFIEQPDSDLLVRTGLDPEGAFYKIGRDGVENSLTSSILGVGKRTRKDEDNSDLQALVDGISPSNPNREQYVFDHVDIAATINYLAVTSLIHNNDHPHKNYHVYRDTEGSGQWMFIPWDMDLTFGLNFGIGGIVGDVDPFGHPFFGDSDHPKIDGPWNRLIDAMFEIDSVREMYVRRLRTLMDEFLLPPGAGETSWIENRIGELSAMLAPHVGSTNWQGHVNNIVNEYLVERRQHLYVNHSILNPGYPDNAGIPNAQVGNPLIQFGTIDYNPASGNQNEEYIELVNPNATAVDISGWQITGAIDYTFRGGTVIPAGGSLFVAADVPSFLARSSGPRGGQMLFVQGNYDGFISSQGESFALLAADGSTVANATTPADETGTQSFIRISEMNYHPYNITPAELAALPGATEDDFDFIEIVNTHTTQPIDLQGMQLANGLSFTFGNTVLAPGERAVVVENIAAFEVRYGTGINVVGQWSGALSNSGETIELIAASGTIVVSIAYTDDPPWPTTPDGDGPTLEIIDASGDASDPANWRASAEFGGTPGAPSESLPLAGDYDRSGTVDQLDYAVWRSSFGSTVATPFAGADGNGDGRIDAADYTIWRDNLGNTSPAAIVPAASAVLAVGEPAPTAPSSTTRGFRPASLLSTYWENPSVETHSADFAPAGHAFGTAGSVAEPTPGPTWQADHVDAAFASLSLELSSHESDLTAAESSTYAARGTAAETIDPWQAWHKTTSRLVTKAWRT